MYSVWADDFLTTLTATLDNVSYTYLISLVETWDKSSSTIAVSSMFPTVHPLETTFLCLSKKAFINAKSTETFFL